ncbi:MAG: alpha/beta hydrolase [Ignavibacteriaceae bacterium]|nr:alpha/beta hydrolase [Ignavibacteriaceae bacterium]
MKNVNGIRVYTAGDPANKPLVFIHGFPFSAAMWKKQIDKLKDNYYCVSYDIRGLGESEKGDGLFTMEMFVDDLFMIMDELKLSKPVIIGLSMGGYILYRAIARNPERFSAAVICGSKPEADGNDAKLKRADAIKKINSVGAEAFIRDFIPTTFWSESIPVLGNEFTEFLNGLIFTPAGSLKGCQLAMAGRLDNTSALEKTELPILFICGDYDTFSPPEVMKANAALCKNGKYVQIADAGHLAPFEKPDEVNAAILDFLKKPA